MDFFFGLLGFFAFFGLYTWGWIRISRVLNERKFNFFLRHSISLVLAFFPAFFSLLPLILISEKEQKTGAVIFFFILFFVSLLVLFYTTKVKAVESGQLNSNSRPGEESVIVDAPVSAAKELKQSKKECTCRLCSRHITYFTHTCPRCRAWQPAYSLRTHEISTIFLVILVRLVLKIAFDLSFFSWIDWLYVPAALIWTSYHLLRLQRDDEAILEQRRYDPNRVYPTPEQVANAHRMQVRGFAQDILKFVYEDVEGKTSTRTIKNWEEDSVYIEGFCLDKRAVRTFRKDRVVKYLDGTDLLLNNPEHVADELKTTWEPATARQILFTGFSKVDRALLEQNASANGFEVCQSVTVSLDYICAGKNAGEVKLAEARKRGAIELNEAEFNQLIETGEVPIRCS